MNARDEMTCAELVEVVTDYLEGAMAPGDRARFEAHLEECPYCVNYLGQIRTAVLALGRLEAEIIPPPRREELLEAFRGWRAR
jgi:anti-sigma factor RsiW